MLNFFSLSFPPSYLPFSVMLRFQPVCCLVSIPFDPFLVASKNAFSHILTLSDPHAWPCARTPLNPLPPCILLSSLVALNASSPSFSLACYITLFNDLDPPSLHLVPSDFPSLSATDSLVLWYFLHHPVLLFPAHPPSLISETQAQQSDHRGLGAQILCRPAEGADGGHLCWEYG